MATAPELFALQETDQALDRAQARLAEIEAQLVESEELVSAREVVEERRKNVEELRSRLSDAEFDAEDARGKASEVEDKLYGGKVTNPKELSDLDADFRSLKAQLARREDTLLALLVEIDDTEKQLNTAKSAYAEIESGWKQVQEALLREKAEIELEITSLQARRERQVAGMDSSSLRLYQLLRDRYGGRAVARLERGMCQGCRITLPTSILSKARSGTGLVQCVSCERILLVD
jgi:predicted  nucleic acid-binding Zn-ribbon protein